MATARPLASDDPGPAIRHRLAGFATLLRKNGFAIGLAETRDALQLLGTAAGQASSSARSSLRSLFCGRRSDWDRFDELFAAHWMQRGMKTVVRPRHVPKAAPALFGPEAEHDAPGSETGPADHIERLPDDDGAETIETRLPKRDQASAAEALGKKDFRHIVDADELAATHALAGRLARSMRARITRRYRAKARGKRLDLRRTIHRSIGTGGTPVRLIHRRRKPKPLRLVILLDVSGSMSVYAPVFVRFMHGVLGAFREAETFLFHTRLMHVTPALREKDAGRAVERLSLLATGVGGGTEIGASLAAFNRFHARRVIHSRTAIMIISDGYDTGEPVRLASEMAALRRRCRRIAWLNPMIGWRDYAPEARGMKAALPFVDLFAPAHNLDSLLAIEPFLASL
ncbi:vWA domain-containing protein [Lichenihabitans psoromatis]|uniref:vWA domain-containing protein n=1 Tax=Lichenihabitans psoromatis TaxID=2528642 RepID=UPI0010384D12|nr:VWA domain-containing protein [Lichenihabitans psoromatis]